MLPRRSQQIGNSRCRGELRDDAVPVRAAQPRAETPGSPQPLLAGREAPQDKFVYQGGFHIQTQDTFSVGLARVACYVLDCFQGF